MTYLKTQLTELDNKKVSIKTSRFISEDGVEYEIDNQLPHRRAFVNSERGRLELLNAYNAGEVSEEDYNAIMAKWGDTPTVVEPEQEEGVI